MMMATFAPRLRRLHQPLLPALFASVAVCAFQAGPDTCTGAAAVSGSGAGGGTGLGLAPGEATGALKSKPQFRQKGKLPVRLWPH